MGWTNDQLNSLYIYSATDGTLILSVTDQGLQMFSAVTGIRDLLVNDNGLGVYSSTTGLLLMGVTGNGMVLNAPARKFRMDTSAFTITAIPDTGAYLQMTTASGFGGLIFLQPENSSVVGNLFVPANIFVDSDETVTDSRPYLKLTSPCIDSTPDLHTAQVVLHGQALLSASDDSFVELAAASTQVNGLLNLGGAGSTPEDAIGSTSNGTTASATFVNSLTTTGIHGTTFVAPPSGAVFVIATCVAGNDTAGDYSVMDWEVRAGSSIGSGTVARAANENTAAVVQSGTANNQGALCSMGIASGLTAGSTYNACLAYHRATGGTSTFNRRHIVVMPLGNI